MRQTELDSRRRCLSKEAGFRDRDGKTERGWSEREGRWGKSVCSVFGRARGQAQSQRRFRVGTESTGAAGSGCQITKGSAKPRKSSMLRATADFDGVVMRSRLGVFIFSIPLGAARGRAGRGARLEAKSPGRRLHGCGALARCAAASPGRWWR